METIKINVEVEPSILQIQELMKNLSEDEICDAIRVCIDEKTITKGSILGRFFDDFKDDIVEVLIKN